MLKGRSYHHGYDGVTKVWLMLLPLCRVKSYHHGYDGVTSCADEVSKVSILVAKVLRMYLPYVTM
jgi:hypothetical protein